MLFAVTAALLPKVVVQRYEHPFGPWRRRYMVCLVSVIAAMLCADQNLLAPNVSAVALGVVGAVCPAAAVAAAFLDQQQCECVWLVWSLHMS
jgi:hypothetical protein